MITISWTTTVSRNFETEQEAKDFMATFKVPCDVKSITNNTKKYEFIGEIKNGLHRIRALKDFGTVKAGDLGG